MAAEALAGCPSIAVVCESPIDRDTARLLASRVLCERVPWLAEQADWTKDDPLAHVWTWRGLGPADSFLDIHKVPLLAREKGFKPHGKFQGDPAAPGAQCFRKALLLLEAAEPRPDAAVLLWDADEDEAGRYQGLAQARSAGPWRFAVVIGLATPEREAWVICGFAPRDDDERERVQALRRDLGLQPRERSHELSAGRPEHARDCKRVLNTLTTGSADGRDSARERACLRETPLADLRRCGSGDKRGPLTGNGLPEFLGEIAAHLPPLFSR